MSNEIRVNRAEINRLTKAISAEEQNMNAAFQRMGQTYFTSHRNDPEENQVANVQAVLDCIENAKRYKEQINVLRGIAICPNCKTEVSIKAAFCSVCGTRMPVQAPSAPPAAPGATPCPGCGNLCPAGTRFCNRCGTRLPAAGAAPAAPTYAAAPAAPAYAAAPMTPPAEPVAPPAPAAEPAPQPAYQPTPQPSFQPIPQPVVAQPPQQPQPVMNYGYQFTASQPAEPAPMPEPEPAPMPEPEPAPMPEPDPVPELDFTPAAEPVPEPAAEFYYNPVPEPTFEPAPEPVFNPVPEPAPVSNKKICPKCGSEMNPEYRFCLECGYQLS